MKKNKLLNLISLDFTHLFFFAAILFIGLSFLFRGDTITQIKIAGVLLVFYLGIQFIHHYFDKSLTKEVLVEYILIALLIGLIFFDVFNY